MEQVFVLTLSSEGFVCLLFEKNFLFKLFQHLFTMGDTGDGFCSSSCPEPVAFYDSFMPASNLFQFLADLFGLSIGKILAEGFKLNLFGKVDFAIFDNLIILKIALRDKAIDNLAFFGGGELAQRKQMKAAV